MSKDVEINLERISKLWPNAYSVYYISKDEERDDIENVLHFMRDMDLRIKVSLNVLTQTWFYEVFQRPTQRNYVRKYGNDVENFEDAVGAAMDEAWALIEFTVKPKPEEGTFLDAITAKAIRRQQQLKYFKKDLPYKRKKK